MWKFYELSKSRVIFLKERKKINYLWTWW